MQPVKDIVPCKEYRDGHTKLKGIKTILDIVLNWELFGLKENDRNIQVHS